MIDLRKNWQYYKGCYIEKKVNGYWVGKNGTSLHFFIEKSKSNKKTKQEILTIIDYILSQLDYYNQF